jgi:hypothetical protein
VAKLEVLAGDFTNGGFHEVMFGQFKMLRPQPKIDSWLSVFLSWLDDIEYEFIPFAEIAEMEKATEESITRLGGAVGWGLAGSLAFGGVGMLAGLLRGGKAKEVMFVCTFVDGRKMIAKTDSKTYERILAKCLENIHSPQDFAIRQQQCAERKLKNPAKTAAQIQKTRWMKVGKAVLFLLFVGMALYWFNHAKPRTNEMQKSAVMQQLSE